MKLSWFLLSFFLVGCSGSSKDVPGDFRTAKERTEEERKGSVFGKDALSWKWSKNGDEKIAESDDPLWAATSRIMAEHPISFSNVSARIIQTDWVEHPDKKDLRSRFTVRLLGKEPTVNNLDVLVMTEKKQASAWVSTSVDTQTRNALISKIIMEAARIYDENKRD